MDSENPPQSIDNGREGTPGRAAFKIVHGDGDGALVLEDTEVMGLGHRRFHPISPEAALGMDLEEVSSRAIGVVLFRYALTILEQVSTGKTGTRR